MNKNGTLDRGLFQKIGEYLGRENHLSVMFLLLLINRC